MIVGAQHRQKISYSILIIIGLSLMPGMALGGTDRLYSKAVDRAVAQLVDSIEARSLTQRRIVISKIDNDSDGLARDAFITALSTTGRFEVVSDSEELERLMNKHSEQLKYQDFYDESTLQSLGRFIGAQLILVGKIQTIELSSIRVHIRLAAKVLDLRNGTIVWSEIIETSETVSLSQSQLGSRLAVICGVMALFGLFFRSKRTVLYYSRATIYWVFVVGCALILFYFLIGRYYIY